MHRPAVSAPLPGLFITSLPRRQRCGSGAAANNGAEAGAASGGFPTDDEQEKKNGREMHFEEGQNFRLIKQPASSSVHSFYSS